MNLSEENVFRPLASFFHGASPTSLYCGNSLFQLMQMQKKQTCQKSSQCVEPETNFSGYSQAHISAFNGETEMIEKIIEESMSLEEINQPDANGNTPLMWSSLEGNAEMIQVLIDNGAFVNQQNFKGETALFLTSAYGHLDACRILLENGANPNLTNMEGASPAHMAVIGGHLEVLSLLNSFGAFMNAQDEEGDTLLHYAVREGQEKIIEFLLLNARASVNIANEDMETPLELAECLEEFRIAEFLRSFQSNYDLEATFDMSL